ncbi:MAG: flavin reductase family protein [Lachnospiraceae bacterium]|nr:flavin reductase family protein [Lachnospiraceae bacterium]
MAKHVFQPIPVDLFECNPFNKIGKEWALITAGDKDKVNTMTVSWGGMGVMWGKNVFFLFIRDSRYTKEFIDNNSFLSVSFLGEEYREALNYCGSHSGRKENKIQNAGLTVGYKMGIPYIDEADAVVIGQKLSATRLTEDSFLTPDIAKKWYQDGDMHTMYILEVMDIMAR